jgi:hypothetical protein
MKTPRNKKTLCTVSAAALMLGVSSAATVGLHFQLSYCGAPSYTGFPVTMTAFGIESNGWENLAQMQTGYGTGDCALLGYTLNEVINTTTSTGGLNPLPNGSITVNWFGPTANFSGFAGYAGFPPSYDYNGQYPGPGITISGEEEIYSTFLRDGYNFGPGESGGVNNQPGYLVDVTGLSTLFPSSPFVVELIAAADSMQALTNAYVIDVQHSTTNSVTYPSTPPITDNEGGEPWVRGHGGGLSTVSGALNTDHIQIMSNHPLGGGNTIVGFDNAGTISGFIVTDKPVVSMYPQSIPVAGPGDSILLSAYAIGVPPLSYQWRLNGQGIPGATNTSYAISNVNSVALGGNYDLVVTNLYGTATSRVSTVTVDRITQTPSNGIAIHDSNPSNPQHDGVNMGSTWLASSSDGTITRTGVEDFVAADTNGISVQDNAAFDGPTGTITLWMRSAGTDQSNPDQSFGASLFCRATGTSTDDFMLIQSDGGSLYFLAPEFGNGYYSSGGVSDNNWHFVALTFDQSASGGAAIYIDGALDSTNANSGSWTWPVGNPLEIGYTTDSYFRDYNGLLDDVRYYSTILSASQIAAIHSSGALENTSALQLQFNFTTAPGLGITLTWLESSAVLQSAPTVSGPWTDVPGATSPQVIFPTATQQYFRYRYTPQSLVSNPYLM